MQILNAEIVVTGHAERAGLDVRPYLISELARSLAELLTANPAWIYEECEIEDRLRDQRRLRVTLLVKDAYIAPKEPATEPPAGSDWTAVDPDRPVPSIVAPHGKGTE